MLLKEQSVNKNINIGLAEKALMFYTGEAQEINDLIINDFYKLVEIEFIKLIEKYPSVKRYFNELSEKEQKNFIKAPEVLSMLFVSDESLSNIDVNYFLLRLIEAENAKKSGAFDVEKFGESLWSADGSFMISYDNSTESFTTFEHPTLSNTSIPQDYFSHFNLINSRDKDHYSSEGLKPLLYSFEEVDVLAERLSNIYDGFTECFKNFICTYTNVLMLKKTRNEKLFTSGTDSRHINRVIITNAHSVSDEVVADAMIHEAIHGTLTIIDVFNEWQPSRKISKEFGKKIYSPWTGNFLTIRNLVQAIYVWYGLYNFWKTKPVNLSKEYAEDRLVFIEKGFKNLDITPYRDIISSTTFEELLSIKNKFI